MRRFPSVAKIKENKQGAAQFLNFLKKKLSKIYMESVLKKEKEFEHGDTTIKHLFIENKSSDRLLVVFSGFPPDGGIRSYNYVMKFRDTGFNRLYILDTFGDDERGSYYLGKNKDFFIVDAVSALIKEIMDTKGITKDKVVTAGSSKGGYAALYYTFANQLGSAVVGAPQIKLGKYLSHPLHRNIMRYIAGGDGENDINYLNGLLLDLIKTSNHKPHLYLHVSKNEHHYEDHMIPLTNLLDSKEIPYILELGEYEHHGDVGYHYSMFARNFLHRKRTGQYDKQL